MTVCPIALAVGCRKCPIFAVCPVKGIIGDYKAPAAEPEPEKRASAKAKSSPAKSRSAKSRARRK